MSTTLEKITVMVAFDAGASVEVSLCGSPWEPTIHPCWDWVENNYRIKPPRTSRINMLAYYNTKELNLVWYNELETVTNSNFKRVPAEDKVIEIEV